MISREDSKIKKDPNAKKPAASLLNGVDFDVEGFMAVDEDELEESPRNDDTSDTILSYSMLHKEYINLRRYIKCIDDGFEALPAERRFAVLADLRDRKGLDAEFAKVAAAFFTFNYACGMIKCFKTFVTENNRLDFVQEASAAAQEAFLKYDPKKTSAPMPYIGIMVYEALFNYVNNQIYGRSSYDAKQFIFVGKIMQELIAAGMEKPEAGDISLQQYIKVNSDKNRMNVGKIKFYMTQLNTTMPTRSIYGEEDEEEVNILDSFDSSNYSYEYQDPAKIAIDTQVAADIFRIISRMVKDERDAKAFIYNRFLGKSIEEIKNEVYHDEIGRDTITRRLNTIAQKIERNDDLTKIRFGINEVTEIQREREATIASTDELLDEIALCDEYDTVARIDAPIPRKRNKK